MRRCLRITTPSASTLALALRRTQLRPGAMRPCTVRRPLFQIARLTVFSLVLLGRLLLRSVSLSAVPVLSSVTLSTPSSPSSFHVEISFQNLSPGDRTKYPVLRNLHSSPFVIDCLLSLQSRPISPRGRHVRFSWGEPSFTCRHLASFHAIAHVTSPSIPPLPRPFISSPFLWAPPRSLPSCYPSVLSSAVLRPHEPNLTPSLSMSRAIVLSHN